MGTFIFIVIMSGLGYFILRMNNESKIEKFLIRQGNKKPTNQDIYEELNKRKRILKEMQFVTIQDKKQNDFIDNELIAAVENNFGKKEKELTKKEIGDMYEEFIAEHYRSLGYEVEERGKLLGRADKGIDLIATKDKELLLIQCKNWAVTTKIEKKHLSEFIGDVAVYLEKYQNINYEVLRRIYVMSNQSLHGSAKHYLRENEKFLECLHIPMK